MDLLVGRRLFTPRPAPDSFLAACVPPAKGLRIRVLRRSPHAAVDAEGDARVVGAARVLESLGHHVDEAAPLEGDIDEFIPLMARMVANIPIPPFLTRVLQPTTVWLRGRGKTLSNADAQTLGAGLAERVLAWFGDADAWITPTVATTAPRVGSFADLDGEGVFRAAAPIGAFTAPYNVSGQPAASVPAGRSSAGLPIGVQIVGPMQGEKTVLALATVLEQALRQ